MTRSGSAKDDALSEEDFDRLVKACEQTDQPIENRFVILMAGMLGLRIGEIAHMKKSWIDFDRELITIPHHEPCACSYCITRMKKRMKRKNIPPREVMGEQWRPKSEAGARTIYFGFDPEVKEVLKTIMIKYKQCPFIVTTIYSRIRRLGKTTGLDVYPHALRATAGFKFAFDGINAKTLQTIMGWSNLLMADAYIRSSGAMAKKEIERVYGKNKHSLLGHNPRRVFYLTDLGKKLMNRRRGDGKERMLRVLLTASHRHGPKQTLLEVF